MSLIGLDVGTTGCKAIVFCEDGRVLGLAAREYPVHSPQPHWAEQDLEQVWNLACSALAEAVSAVKKDPPAAMALSVHGEAVVPVDRRGKPLRRAILGMDTRTGEENRWLSERFGAESLFNRTGMPLHTINTLPKMLWLKKWEPDVWKKADRFLLVEDFFLRRLGGQAVISHCLASRTQMYDLKAGAWAEDILRECGIETSRLSPLAPEEGGAVGTMTAEAATLAGLKNPLTLVSGGHDQACAALGSGVLDGDTAMVSTGTAEVVEVAMTSPVLNDPLRNGNISIYRHVVPRLYLAMTLNHSGGLLLRWFRDELCRPQEEESRNTGRDAYDLIFDGAPDGPTGLLVLPHFAGSGTPLLDTASRGAILGLTFSTTRSAIAKALLEGLTYELRVNLDLLRAAGVSIRVLHAVGGGARSPLWLKLKADICGLPIRVPRVTEAACLGAALLAGTAAGVYPDLHTAVSRTVRIAATIEPDPESARLYEDQFKLYREVYPALAPLHHRMESKDISD
jgi:xylulokinase